MTPPVYATLFVSLAAAIVISAVVAARHLSASRQARAQLTTGREYRALADEFRRLSDMAITAQEHVDLRLTDHQRAGRGAQGPDGTDAAHPEGSRIGPGACCLDWCEGLVVRVFGWTHDT